MSLWSLFSGKGGGHDVDELCRRLGLDSHALDAIEIRYTETFIPKRGGAKRRLLVPNHNLKQIQRIVYARLLRRLKSHPNATGFEPGHSIVTNASHHANRAVVVCMDIKDFFPSTSAKRVTEYFRVIGWSKEAAKLLTRLCTYENALPQGAPTSPRLSNLVNYRLDVMLAGYAAKHGIAYTRYADDLVFSYAEDDTRLIHATIRVTKRALEEFGYRLHQDRKLRIRRRHQQQIVTGLVVNERVQLPRHKRRWLRAVEHRQRTGGAATLDTRQIEGWRALQHMIESQRG